MNIAFLCNEYPPFGVGGIGSFTKTLAEGLVRNGHQVSIFGIYPSDAGEHSLSGVTVIKIQSSSVPRFAFAFNSTRLWNAIKKSNQKQKIDVLEAPNSGLALLPKLTPFPKIMRFHGGHVFFSKSTGSPTKMKRAWLERRSIAKADFLCAVSKFNASMNHDLHNLGSRTIKVIYNPVDTNFFSPGDQDLISKGRILFLGNFSSKKGVLELTKAAINVLRLREDFHLMMVGRDWIDPDTKVGNKSLIRKLIPPDLSHRIILRDQIPHSDVPGLISTAEFCVAPSIMEAHPVLWLEIMSMGKAIVASSLGPGPEVVDHMRTGYLCDPKSLDQLTTALFTLIDDSGLRSRLGKAARDKAIAKFGVGSAVDANEIFYENCLGNWI